MEQISVSSKSGRVPVLDQRRHQYNGVSPDVVHGDEQEEQEVLPWALFSPPTMNTACMGEYLEYIR